MDLKIKETAGAYAVPNKTFTYHDYLELPEDGNRYEIISGELIMVAAPATIHQAVSENIGFKLSTYMRKHKVGKVFYAPVDVVFSQTNVVQPDILFISNVNRSIEIFVNTGNQFTSHQSVKEEGVATSKLLAGWEVDLADIFEV